MTDNNVVVASIAARLRDTATVDEGTEYLLGLNLDHDTLVALADALGRTRVERQSNKQLVQTVIEQAIGARRKFEGLRKW